jgi:hypothetical protein
MSQSSAWNFVNRSSVIRRNILSSGQQLRDVCEVFGAYSLKEMTVIEIAKSVHD